MLDILAPSVFNPTAQRVRARAELYKAGNASTYAYKKDGIYLGLVIFEIQDNKATILDIATDINHHGSGIGSKLIDFIFSKFHVSVIIAETDDDAVGFYRKYGFTVAVCREINGITRYRCICPRK